jgi:hypothetical protein
LLASKRRLEIVIVKKKKNVLEEGVFLTSALPEATQIAYVKILRSPVGGKPKEAKGTRLLVH